MIRGMHALFYSTEAEALRAFLRDKLDLAATDVGGGWLIFDAPEADLGVHPTDGKSPASGTGDISLLLRRHCRYRQRAKGARCRVHAGS